MSGINRTQGEGGQESMRNAAQGGEGQESMRNAAQGGEGQESMRNAAQAGEGQGSMRNAAQAGEGQESMRNAAQAGEGQESMRNAAQGEGQANMRNAAQAGEGQESMRNAAQAGEGQESMRNAAQAGEGQESMRNAAQAGEGQESVRNAAQAGEGQESVRNAVIEEKKQNYEKYVKEMTPVHNFWLQLLKAFLVGGVICTLGQGILNVCTDMLKVDKDTAASLCTLILILLSVLLTGFNIYPRIVKWGGAGALVPITGFANSVAAPAIEFKKEGWVFGVGCKIFTIAGPVILYGILTSWVLGVICWIWEMF